MPAVIHAILVVRPDAHASAAHRLERMQAALSAQTRPVDRLTVVLCGPAPKLAAAASTADVIAADVVTAPRGTRFADAVRRATGADPTAHPAADAVWLLAQDTLPEPDALAVLADELDRSPSVAVAAPKLVRWDDRARIVSLGVSMTRFGRTVELADGEYDQGQHDDAQDVLGADIRGVLVRGSTWDAVGGIDPALAGADEGLDLGVRARLAGSRVSVAPAARVIVYGDGVAQPAGFPPYRGARAWYARRLAQLHRRLAYARAGVVPLVWLAVLPLALWRTAVQLVAKTPERIVPEWRAAAVALVRLPAVARARARIRRARSAPWAQLAPLRVDARTLRTGLHTDDHVVAPRRADLRFFSGGGAWTVLAALAVSIAVFPSLLVWPALGGGALAPLRSTLGRLWADAGYGLQPLGLHEVGPADPFSAVVAVMGTAWPADPSRAVVLLWLAALPLAALGGWFAATRVTDRSVLRVTGAVAWAVSPAFLAALTQGRPAAVLVHLLLPWLLFAAVVAHRSWGAAGAASLLSAAVVACAPSLAPALALLWLVLLGVAVGTRRSAGGARVGWMPIPALVLAAPLILHQLRLGDVWGLLADPGVPWAGPQVAADAAGRALLSAGTPTTDPGGWAQLLRSGGLGHAGSSVPADAFLILLVPLGLLAALSVFTRRWLAGAMLVLVAVTGLVCAMAVTGVAVVVSAGTAVPVWPGNALSLMWAGAVGAALLTLDIGLRRAAPVDADAHLVAGRGRSAAAVVVMVTLCVFAVPALTAHLRGASNIADGPTSTLPAYVAAEGRGDAANGTVVVRPLADGSIAAGVVWGESATLGGQPTALVTRVGHTASDVDTAAMAAALVSPSSSDVVTRLAADGIGFVLLAPAGADDDRAQSLRLQAVTALDERGGLDAVGETTAGTLWRITVPVAQRAGVSAGTRALAAGILTAQLLAVAIALLLAVPTGSSRRRARHTPRVVGRTVVDGGA